MKKDNYKKIKALDQIILILLLFSFIKIMQTKSEIKNELIILFLGPVNLICEGFSTLPVKEVVSPAGFEPATP